MASTKSFRAGYITIVGKPNVGKSTLMNKLLDFKLSIISPRPQTTRKRIMGIMTKPNFQIIFLDTPGLLDAKYKLQRNLKKFIDTSIADADIILYMIEMRDQPDQMRPLIEEDIDLLYKINPQKKPVVLVINKVDLYPKENLLPMLEIYSELYPFLHLMPISALKEDGFPSLEQELVKNLPIHESYYDSEMLTEQPERFFVSEFIREQIFFHFHEEIPYSTEVQIEEFIERTKGKDKIRAIIYVERDSQKGIIIGKKGKALKMIGIKSRKVIEEFLGREVFLELQVKVSKNWRKSEQQIRRFGY